MGKFYIAYGSNMDERQMAYRCPTARLVGKSEIVGYGLLFKGSKTGAYATIEPKTGSRVPVLLWEIEEEDERNLNRYEGFPAFYYKKNLKLEFNGGKKTAMVYIMDEKSKPGVPSRGYYDIMDRAYDKFGFNKSILKQAVIGSGG